MYYVFTLLLNIATFFSNLKKLPKSKHVHKIFVLVYENPNL